MPLEKNTIFRLPWSKNDNPIGWLEVTDICNLKCLGCYRQKLYGHKTLDEIKNEILFLKKWRNVDNLSIAGGEPPMYPEIMEVVAFAKQQGIKPIMLTNGVKLARETVVELKKAGLAGFTIHIDSNQGRPQWRDKNEVETNELRQHFADMIYAIGGLYVLDRLEESFGLRTLEIRVRGPWVNGERVRLTGITRQEESPQEGLAETRGTMKADWDDLKALQVTLTRPVHYPQHPYVLDYADRNGVLLVPEIPMWQFSEEQMKDPAVLALAKRMMQEMIEQAGNHPSVFAWSICNESATSTPGGRAYVKAMVEHVKALDPGRYVSYPDDGLGQLADAAQNANQHTDFVMMNQYFGSWHGPASGLAPALDRVGTMFPDKMVVVSVVSLHGDSLSQS